MNAAFESDSAELLAEAGDDPIERKRVEQQIARLQERHNSTMDRIAIDTLWEEVME